MSSTTHSNKTPRRARWERVGSARVAGLGVRIETGGMVYAISADGIAALINDGEPATLYEIDPAARVEPREAGSVTVSQSGRMILIQVNGREFTGLQVPARDLVAHYTRADRAPVAVVTPPTPSSQMVPA